MDEGPQVERDFPVIILTKHFLQHGFGHGVGHSIKCWRPPGTEIRGVAPNVGTVVQEEKRTIGAALGMIYVGQRLGDYSSPLQLPSYTRWDAGLFYRYRMLNSAVLFENVFDEHYFASAQNSQSVLPGNPFTVRATVGIKF